MKKIFSVFASSIILVLPIMVLAQQPGPDQAPQWGELDVMQVLEKVTNWLFAILLIVAAIFIIMAGYFFVTAQGDPDKVKTARNFVLYALVGVLVGFVAKALVMFIDTIVRT